MFTVDGGALRLGRIVPIKLRNDRLRNRVYRKIFQPGRVSLDLPLEDFGNTGIELNYVNVRCHN